MINLFFSNLGGDKLNLIFEGDSITEGNNVGENEDYPYLTFSRYFDNGRNKYDNRGTSSDTALNIDTNKTEILTSFDNTYTNVLILLIGINDIANATETNAQIYEHIKNIWAYVRENNGLVVACTILPAGTLSAWETNRTEINGWIREDDHLYDYLADFGADETIGLDGSQDNLIYYLSDKVHPNVNGNNIMANIVGNINIK